MMSTWARPQHVGDRPGDVVGPQPSIERQTLGERHQLRGRPAFEPSVPQRLARCASGHVAHDRPASSRRWSANALAAEGLVGNAHQGVVTGDRADEPTHSRAIDRRRDHMRTAGRGAQHDEVRRHLDLGDPLAHHPPQLILRRDACRLVLGDRIDRLAAGHPDLHGAEIFEVARHRGLRCGDPFVGQQIDELRLIGDGVLADELADDLLPLHLAGHQRTPIRNASAPRAACIRLWACLKT